MHNQQNELKVLKVGIHYCKWNNMGAFKNSLKVNDNYKKKNPENYEHVQERGEKTKLNTCLRYILSKTQFVKCYISFVKHGLIIKCTVWSIGRRLQLYNTTSKKTKIMTIKYFDLCMTIHC